MESRENYDISKELNIEKYKENARLLNKTKEKILEMGLFDKDFIDGLTFVFFDNHNKEEDVNYQLTENGLLVPYEEFDKTKEVPIITRSYLDTIDDQFNISSDRNKSQYVWLGNLDKTIFLSFEAAAVHETAHAKSYSVIDRERKSSLDKEKFKELIAELIKDDLVLSKMESIDLSKFNYSEDDWSEIYALLYHREFLRKENSENNKMIEEWDSHISEVANDLQGAVKKFNEKRGTDIDPEVVYEDCHTLSFFLARVFEEKYKDLNERIKVLESCKKE